MNQIFNTITYLHENDIFDINLKLENIILIEKTIKSNKKIIKSKKTKELSNQDNFKKKIETKLSILGYLKDFYSNSELDEIKYYAPEIIEQIEQNNLTKKNNKKKTHRPTSILANQNMNNFSHLFKNYQNANIDILWTLNLRQSDNSTNLKIQIIKMVIK